MHSKTLSIIVISGGLSGRDATGIQEAQNLCGTWTRRRCIRQKETFETVGDKRGHYTQMSPKVIECRKDVVYEIPLACGLRYIEQTVR